MRIYEYYLDGDEKELENQIKNILARYFPKVSIESEIIPNRIIGNQKLNNETAINASISFSISMEQKEIKSEKKIDEISFKIEEPDKIKDQTLTSEIFLG